MKKPRPKSWRGNSGLLRSQGREERLVVKYNLLPSKALLAPRFFAIAALLFLRNSTSAKPAVSTGRNNRKTAHQVLILYNLHKKARLLEKFRCDGHLQANTQLSKLKPLFLTVSLKYEIL
jgi:hypothetical protein